MPHDRWPVLPSMATVCTGTRQGHAGHRAVQADEHVPDDPERLASERRSGVLCPFRPSKPS